MHWILVANRVSLECLNHISGDWRRQPYTKLRSWPPEGPDNQRDADQHWCQSTLAIWGDWTYRSWRFSLPLAWSSARHNPKNGSTWLWNGQRTGSSLYCSFVVQKVRIILVNSFHIMHATFVFNTLGGPTKIRKSLLYFRYRHEMRSDALFSEMKLVIGQFAEPLTTLAMVNLIYCGLI